jgi:mono/diheme cytochrome c family protein
MDSGFPHGADGWISSAATSWAVMALALAHEPGQTPSGRPLLARATGPTAHGLARLPDPGAGVARAGAPSAVGSTQRPGTQAAAQPINALRIDYARDIQPVLDRSCAACHSGERPKGGFRVTDPAAILRGGARGEPVVVPGKPDASLLMRAVQDQVEDLEMPPVRKRADYPALSPEELGKLRGWIAQGAP